MMSGTGTLRYVRTLALALRFAAQLWWIRRTRRLRGKRQERAERALYTRQAEQFVAFATRMGGLIIKVGQFLSVRIDLLPKEYIDVLGQLQDALPPVPTPQIVAVIERELGRPLPTVFATFDPTPVAAASLGQVHRATLPDGTPVAVKVLRPGIEDLVATDLKTLRALLRLLDRLIGLGRRIDLDVLEADFTATFSDELDYVTEGHHVEEFQRNLLFNPYVDIPQIYWERSSRRVLTMEYMDGVPIDDLAALDRLGIDRHELATRLSGLFFQMVLQDGVFHADPHPGNVFVRPDGVILLVDFGMVGTITPQARSDYARLVLGLVRRDAPGIVAAMRDLGFLGPGADTATLTKLLGPHIDAIIGDVTGFYTGSSIVDAMMGGGVHLTVDADALAGIQQFIYTQPFTLPGDATFLGKALVTVIGLCLRLDPELDLLATAAPYVTHGTDPASILYDLVTKGFDAGTRGLRDLVPTARRVARLIHRLDDGSFEADLTRLVDARVSASQRRQTRQLVSAVGAATALLAWLLHRRR